MYQVSWQKFGINPAHGGRFKGKVDLHFHSQYSDGSKNITFTDIFQIARYYGLSAIALTDHDTIAGLKEFIEASRLYSMPVIAGVEISSSQKDILEIHTLAYGFDLQNQDLQEALSDIQHRLVERFKNMAGWANDQLGENAVTEEEVNQIICAEQGGTFGRPQLAKLLLEKGFFPFKEKDDDRAGAPAFRFLKRATKIFPAPTLDLGRTINLIHSASGLAFMAHPFGNERSPKEIAESLGERTEDLIDYLLANYSYDGIEVAHSEHSWKAIRYLTSLARKKGLLISGGADTHWNEKDTRPFGISPAKALSFQRWMEERLCA